MRHVRYNVAASLDGFIARSDGSFDWILEDPSIDFGEIFAGFDTLLMGRATFELLRAQGRGGPADALRLVVVSTTLRPEDEPDVTVVSDRVIETVGSMKSAPGKDIWLFGGGKLFASLLAAGLVDTVEVAVMPVLLGGGVALLAAAERPTSLRLRSCKSLTSGIVLLSYSVENRERHAGKPEKQKK